MHPDSSRSDSRNGLRKGRSPGVGMTVTDIKGAVCQVKDCLLGGLLTPPASPAVLSDAVDKLPLPQRAGSIHPSHTAPLQPLQAETQGIKIAGGWGEREEDIN